MRKLTVTDFWQRVDRRGPDECWPWKGPGLPSGYGRFGGQGYAHRFAYEVEHGPIPAGMDACHRCDNPPCCNPAHLFAGTRYQNVHDMLAKGRNGQPRGERHPKAKLTIEAVREIRRLKGVVPSRELARQYGVDNKTIRKIIDGTAWRCVPDEVLPRPVEETASCR